MLLWPFCQNQTAHVPQKEAQNVKRAVESHTIKVVAARAVFIKNATYCIKRPHAGGNMGDVILAVIKIHTSSLDKSFLERLGMHSVYSCQFDVFEHSLHTHIPNTAYIVGPSPESTAPKLFLDERKMLKHLPGGYSFQNMRNLRRRDRWGSTKSTNAHDPLAHSKRRLSIHSLHTGDGFPLRQTPQPIRSRCACGIWDTRQSDSPTYT